MLLVSFINPSELLVSNSHFLAGNCLLALSKGKGTRVPYRDHKLTHILKYSLGGEAKTLMITAVNPAAEYMRTTLQSLKYASQSQKINVVAVWYFLSHSPLYLSSLYVCDIETTIR